MPRVPSEKLAVDCPTCQAKVIGENRYSLQLDEEPFQQRFTLLQCPRCNAPLLVGQGIVRLGDGDSAFSEPYRLFPSPARSLGPAVPETIRRTFSGAEKCHRAGVYEACVLMCRKVLEQICLVQNASGKNLAQMIDALKASGVIDKQLYEWADELRLAGNQAAHDVDANLDSTDAGDLLDFTEALAEYIFTLRKKFEEFQLRRMLK